MDNELVINVVKYVGDLLEKHGALLITYHRGIKEILVPMLRNPRMAVRKRAYNAFGYLVYFCLLPEL